MTRLLAFASAFLFATALVGCGAPVTDSGHTGQVSSALETVMRDPSSCIALGTCPVAEVLGIHLPDAAERAAGGVICDSCDDGMPACSNCGIAMGPDVAVVLPPGLNDGRALVVGSPNGSVTFYPPPRASAFFVPASAAAPDTGDIISVYRPQP